MVGYKKSLVEVDEVLNYLNEEDLNRIPIEIRKEIKRNKAKDYVWKYDITKNINEQNLSRDAIAMLSYLNIEHIVNKEQKAFLKEMYKFNQNKTKNST